MPKAGNKTGESGGQFHNTNTVKHGAFRADSHLQHDRRTKHFRYLKEMQEHLTEAIGGDPSPQQGLIIQRVSFKALRCSLAEFEMISANGNTADFLKVTYLRWCHSLREDLKLLGMQRKAKGVKNLQQYVQETYGREGGNQ